jgi:hypothetical protein
LFKNTHSTNTLVLIAHQGVCNVDGLDLRFHESVSMTAMNFVANRFP